MSSFALSQVLVGVAICFDLISFQCKQRQHIVACLCCSCSLIALHFALLGIWTAMGLAFLAAVRLGVSYFTTSKKVMLFFIGGSLLLALCTYGGGLSVLSCLGAVLGTIGSFCADDRRLRQVMMGATTTWLVHNMLAGSPTAVLMEGLFLVSNLLGYYRYYLRRVV